MNDQYLNGSQVRIWKPDFWIFMVGQLFSGLLSLGVLWVWSFVPWVGDIPTWGYVLAFTSGMTASDRIMVKRPDE